MNSIFNHKRSALHPVLTGNAASFRTSMSSSFVYQDELNTVPKTISHNIASAISSLYTELTNIRRAQLSEEQRIALIANLELISKHCNCDYLASEDVQATEKY